MGCSQKKSSIRHANSSPLLYSLKPYPMLANIILICFSVFNTLAYFLVLFLPVPVHHCHPHRLWFQHLQVQFLFPPATLPLSGLVPVYFIFSFVNFYALGKTHPYSKNVFLCFLQFCVLGYSFALIFSITES